MYFITFILHKILIIYNMNIHMYLKFILYMHNSFIYYNIMR